MKKKKEEGAILTWRQQYPSRPLRARIDWWCRDSVCRTASSWAFWTLLEDVVRTVDLMKVSEMHGKLGTCRDGNGL